MKKGYLKILGIEVLFLILFSLEIVFYSKLNFTIFLLELVTLFGIMFFVCGYEKNHHRYQKDMMMNITIVMIFYYLSIYLFGLKIGFLKNGYSLQFFSILKNITPVIIIIILEELIRYEIVTKGKGNKIIFILQIILFIVIDGCFSIHSYDIYNLEEFIKFIGVVIVPSIFQNGMLTYLNYKVGYRVAIGYRLLNQIPTYILPILPDLGIYVEAVFQVVLPVIVGFIIYSNLAKKKEDVMVPKSRIKIVYGISIFVLLFIVGLTSGHFKYYVLTIGSSSMTPNINKGDVVLVQKYGDQITAQEGEVIVYYNRGKMISHRLIDIVSVGDEKYYYTKGDYNKSKDSYVVKEEDIIGKVIYRISYLGYPTVWLKEKIGNE